MQRFDRITSNPEIVNGKPCIRGTRLTVRTLRIHPLPVNKA